MTLSDAHLAPVSSPSLDPSSHTSNEFIDAFSRMRLGDTCQAPSPSSCPDASSRPSDDLANVTPPPTETSSSHTADEFPANCPQVNQHSRTPLPHRDKREHNIHTSRALKILNDIDLGMEDCAIKIRGEPTQSVREDAANAVSESRRVVEKVTRSTPSINTLKDKVARHILHVENRLIELDTLLPLEVAKGPTEYSNGEISIITQRPPTDQSTQTIILPHRYKNSIQLPKWPCSSGCFVVLSSMSVAMMAISSWVSLISFCSLLQYNGPRTTETTELR